MGSESVGDVVGAPVAPVGVEVGVLDGDDVGVELVGAAVGDLDGPVLGALVVGDTLGEAVGLVGTMVGETEHQPHVRAQFCRIQSVLHPTSASAMVDPGVKVLQAHSARSLHSVGAMVGGVVGLNDGPRLGRLVGAVVGDEDDGWGVVGLNDGPRLGRLVGAVVGDEDDGWAVGGIKQRSQAIGQIVMTQSSLHMFSLANRGHAGMSTQDVGAELGAALGAIGAGVGGDDDGDMVGAGVGQASQLSGQSCAKLGVAQYPIATSGRDRGQQCGCVGR